MINYELLYCIASKQKNKFTSFLNTVLFQSIKIDANLLSMLNSCLFWIPVAVITTTYVPMLRDKVSSSSCYCLLSSSCQSYNLLLLSAKRLLATVATLYPTRATQLVLYPTQHSKYSTSRSLIRIDAHANCVPRGCTVS